MSIIDIMQTRETDSGQITINTANDYETVTYPGPKPGTLVSAKQDGSYANFAPIDLLTILSFGLYLPYGFEYYHDQGTVDLVNVKWQIVESLIPNDTFDLDPDKTFNIWPNYEMSYNKPMDVTQANQFFTLNMKAEGLRISMLNVPEALNGETIFIRSFAKILHEIELDLWE